MDNHLERRKIAVDLLFYDIHTLSKNKVLSLSSQFSDELAVAGLVLARKYNNRYQVYYGAEIVEAAKQSGFTGLHVVVGEIPSEDIEGLVSNGQTAEKLDPIEEAQRYQQLMDMHGLSIGQLTKDYKISSSSKVKNALRLLKLPPRVQDLIRVGKLKASHGRVLSYINDVEFLLELSQRVQDESWDVRTLEDQIHSGNLRVNADLNALSNELAEKLGCPVSLSQKTAGRVKISLQHEFEILIEILTKLVSKMPSIKFKLERFNDAHSTRLILLPTDKDQSHEALIFLRSWR